MPLLDPLLDLSDNAEKAFKLWGTDEDDDADDADDEDSAVAPMLSASLTVSAATTEPEQRFCTVSTMVERASSSSSISSSVYFRFIKTVVR